MSHPFQHHNINPHLSLVATPQDYIRYYRRRRLENNNGWNQEGGGDIRTEIMSIPQPRPRPRDEFGRLIPTRFIGAQSAYSYRLHRQVAHDAALMGEIRSRRINARVRSRRRIAFARGYPLSVRERMRSSF